MSFKKILCSILALAMILSTMGTVVFATETANVSKWLGDVDTSWYDADPNATEFKITSAAQLAGLAKIVNEGTDFFNGDTIVLTTDIDLDNLSWTPIGRATGNLKNNEATSYENDFEGSFDGGKHTIYNLNVNVGDRRAGLFGQLIANSDDYSAYVKDFTICNASVVNTYQMTNSSNKTYVGYAGALAGRVDKYTISNVHLTGEINVSGYSFVGGLIGHCSSNVSDCSVEGYGTVKAANWQCGGLIGSQNREATSVKDCSVTGDEENGGLTVTDQNSAIGGVIGCVQNGINIKISNVDVKNISVVTDVPDYGVGYAVGRDDAGDTSKTELTAINVTAKTTSGEDCEVSDSANITVYVAKVVDATAAAETYYTSLTDAFDNAVDGDTVELLSDIVLDKQIVVRNKSITFDGNGHTISQVSGLAFNDYQAGVRFQGTTDDIAKYNYTVKNVVFDGWTALSVLALHQCTATVDGITIKNTDYSKGTQAKSYGVLYVENVELDLKNSNFINNNGNMTVSYNYGSPKSTANLKIDKCLFEGNKNYGAGTVYYVTGSSCAISNSTFKGNAGNVTGNGSTIYLGFVENTSVTGCTFEDNTVNTSSETSNRVGGAIQIGYTTNITGNTFVNNTATRNGKEAGFGQVCASVCYVNIDLGGNYWGGAAPVIGKDIFVEYTQNDIVVPSYLETAGSEEPVALSAKVGNYYYKTLGEAFAAAASSPVLLADNDTETVIELVPGVTVEEGTVNLPETLNNVKLQGNGVDTVIKDTELLYRGSAINYDGFAVDGVIFDNSWINLEDWTSKNTVKNLEFTNNIFKNIQNDSNVAALHLNTHEAAAIENLTVEGNTFENILGAKKSAIYTNFADGEIAIKNNTFDNIAFRPYIIAIVNNNGTDNSLVVTGNTFANSAVGRLQAYGTDSTGTDNVELLVNDNIITGITDAQQICYWGFNEDETTVDYSYNYYDIDPIENPGKFVLNGSAADASDLDAMNVLPYYTSLNDDGTINRDSLVDGVTNGITVSFDNVTEEGVEGEELYNITLKADEGVINRLNSADLDFVFNQIEGKTDYELIAVKGSNITFNKVEGSEDRYEFHFGTKTDVSNDTGNTVVIAQLKVSGYGKYSFAVETEATTNAVQCTTIDNNIVETFVPGGAYADGKAADGSLNIDNSTTGEVTIVVPSRTLTINVTFPNMVEDNEDAYQNMSVRIVGGDVDETIDLGEDDEDESMNADGNYVIERTLPYNTVYTVTVEGKGYRTARYSVTLTDNKELNFWNNVQDEGYEIAVEEGKDSTKTTKTFLAGEIVKDNQINVYDLSAVVSYFGTKTIDENNNIINADYAKYDLDRNGVIDSKDVAYVLVSWGE